MNDTLISGWFPVTIVIVSTASVVLPVGWFDGALKWQLRVGIPLSFVLTVLTAQGRHRGLSIWCLISSLRPFTWGYDTHPVNSARKAQASGSIALTSPWSGFMLPLRP